MTTDNDDSHRRALLAAHLRRLLAVEEQLAQCPNDVSLALQRDLETSAINALAASLDLAALPAGLTASALAAGLRDNASASLQRQRERLTAYRRATELQLATASPSTQVTLTLALQQANERLAEIDRHLIALGGAIPPGLLPPVPPEGEPLMPGFALSAEQHRRLRALLMRCDEVTNNADLRALFTDERLKPWRAGVPETDNLRSRVDRLIDYLRDKRNTSGQSALTLLLWVLAERYEPDDERHDNLLALAGELTYGFRAILPPNSPTNPQLERKIRASNGMLDIQRWIARLSELTDQVCRISVSQGANVVCGTGFLVAPDIVLTNYHVVQAVITGQASPSDVKLLFDYHLKEDGVTPHVGKSYSLAQDWLIDASPYSSLDLQIDPGSDPNPDQLDYALLRVDGAPGLEQVSRPGGGQIATLPRGHISLPPPQAAPVVCTPNSPILIIQHPDGKELKLAIDTDAVIGMNGNRTRLRYRTNTESGSSGSPCFDADWTLIALHHSGDPNHLQLYHPQYNQGIPIAAIVRLLEQRGKLALLTAH